MTTIATHYLSSTPCKNGHIALRRLDNRSCSECARIKAATKRAYDKAHRPEYSARKATLRKERWKSKEREAHQSRISDPERWATVVLPRIRHRAKKNGIEFTITVADIPLPTVCPVLGIPLKVEFGIQTGKAPGSPSVDRFDNSKGYIPGNVRVISVRANLLKKDANVEEIRRLLAYMDGGSS